MPDLPGKISYGFMFVVVLPICVALWGMRLDHIVGLPPVGGRTTGWLLIALGIGLIISGWWALYRYGNGLPMNAYPPKRFVRQGIYAIISHPIYLGFTILTAGYFMLIASGAGFWLVTPCVALASSALVYGFERHDMEIRFGPAGRQTFLRLPEAKDAAPSLADRVSTYALLFIPWLVIYEAAITLGPSSDAVEAYFAFEQRLPVIEGTEALYAFTYVYVLFAPLASRRKRDLRAFMMMGLWATLIGSLCFMLIPLKATPRSFEPSIILGRLLVFERSLDGPAGAFPSFHVSWAFLAAWVYARAFKMRPVWYLIASAIALSCITTGMHAVVDILGGLALFLLVVSGESVWAWILQQTERLANSWREWRIGRMRIIVHGIYAGMAASVGLVIVAHLSGAQHLRPVLLVSIACLLGAGLWGQIVEGSSILTRPFGYFGGIFGGIAGVLLAAAAGADGGLIAGAFTVAAPFIQAIGRLRCLVQGCCHGRDCDSRQGIVFRHERSRVLYIANLGGRAVFPTQLYSILYNITLGLLLIRAWTLSASMPLLVGGYFILGSLGRFVEESYRGEPQTLRYAGLALYQWLSLAGFAAGALITTLPGKPADMPVEVFPGAFVYAAAFGLIVALAMGVDFPESNRRFSRLT